MLFSSPIEAESSPDWHLTGLLTHASTNLNSLPEATLSGRSIHSTFNSQRIQLRGSGGFAPHFPNVRCPDSTPVCQSSVKQHNHRREQGIAARGIDSPRMIAFKGSIEF